MVSLDAFRPDETLVPPGRRQRAQPFWALPKNDNILFVAPYFLLFLALWPAACRREPVVARVGPLAITETEFQRKLAEVAQSYQNYVATPNGRRQFLDVLIREKLVLAAAKDSDVPRSPEFKAELSRLKADEEERLREGRDYLLARFWIESLRQKGVLRAGDDEIREYHKKYPDEVSARHILAASPDEAAGLAVKARSGANFAALAKAHSLDAATASDGGLMPPAIYGEIIPDLEDVVFRLRTGDVGGPIKSKFGYHVLRKEGRRALAYEQARERIARLIEKQKLDRYLRSISEKFPVEVVDDQFK